MNESTDSASRGRDSREIERLRKAFASLAEEASPIERCPTNEEIFEAANGKLAGEETRRLVEHTSACPSCAESWRLAHEVGSGEAVAGRVLEGRFGSAAETVESADRAPSQSGGRVLAHPDRFRRWMPLAVAALLVLVVGVRQLRSPDGGEVPFREGPETGISSLLPEVPTLPRERCELRWQGQFESPARYHVRVMTADLDPIVEARDLESTSYRLPEELLAGLPAGGELLWQVEAVLADGRRVSSETFRFRLR